MVSSSAKTESATRLTSLVHSETSSGKSKASFAKQLATVVESDAKPKVKTSEAPGHNSGGSQFLVAVTPRAAGAKTGIAASRTLPPRAPMAESTPIAPAVATKAPIAVSAPAVQLPSPQPLGGPAISEGDAYWNAQPAAVQALRGMPDDAAKEKLALNLANQGYSIDTQIMVWGWDPQMTMQVRENQGYSWVPSYGQSNVPVGPGISDPYDPISYNPASPPPGSIKVSTAFAVGTIQNPLVQVDPTDS
jgi:hypothetical protein